jgi:hypothetical protein
MNAVEIEQEVSKLAEQPFDPAEFPYDFLIAFGNKDTTITRLRKGDSNSSDVAGGVLQKNNIHLAVCEPGRVGEMLGKLRSSPKTASAKAKFILATDGITLEAEELKTGETIASDYPAFADHFGFFLPLAGISTVREIKENPIDVRATGRLNKLYVELLKTNEDWQSDARRSDLNHFFARLIFCFFAEDTHIFNGDGLFTQTIQQMTQADGGDTDYVLRRLFEAMNLSLEARKRADLPAWADQFPYVNGGLFSDGLAMPRFTRTARSYLLRAGELNWREINPDIFGSMIQAVSDDEERDNLGMHYTSVPNILKVLNPLFLDAIRDQLEKAGEHKASLLKLRERIERIRVFYPACGSGNFLVIAYKEMRKIEAEINRRRSEEGRASVIPPTNFRGIEIRDFAAEIARLALVIAEYQSDVLYRGERLALAEFLPLTQENWIWKGNALRLDWSTVCPPAGTGVKVRADDLFATELDQIEIDFANSGGETYICGNPPYQGGKGQSPMQKADLAHVFNNSGAYGELDYVAAWFMRAAAYSEIVHSSFAFVATNSINQGAQVHQLWPRLFEKHLQIDFAYEPFKWSNSATSNAAVLCTIIGLSRRKDRIGQSLIESKKKLYGSDSLRTVRSIGPYLVADQDVIVYQSLRPISQLPPMLTGNSPYDGGNLLLRKQERDALIADHTNASKILRAAYGSANFINGESRYCLWITDDQLGLADSIEEVANRIAKVRDFRREGGDVARGLTSKPHRFRYTHIAHERLIIVPRVSSERREYLPVGLLSPDSIVLDSAQAIYDPPLWVLSILTSKLHLAWARTTAGKLKSDIRYSSALCYNTFPMPTLTQGQMAELTRCAEEILIAREAHFPATIADLYDPDEMPKNLGRAHDRNDETLERICIGRRFRNDTERLEKLFEMYSAMAAKAETGPTAKRTRTKRA